MSNDQGWTWSECFAVTRCVNTDLRECFSMEKGIFCIATIFPAKHQLCFAFRKMQSWLGFFCSPGRVNTNCCKVSRLFSLKWAYCFMKGVWALSVRWMVFFLCVYVENSWNCKKPGEHSPCGFNGLRPRQGPWQVNSFFFMWFSWPRLSV